MIIGYETVEIHYICLGFSDIFEKSLKGDFLWYLESYYHIW